ncbi:MAG: PilX N-terminal domain-containing pilus assembly protein [Aestuariibacter sp.]
MNGGLAKQQGLVLVLALLVLMTLTIIGITSVNSSLMQAKMASSLETSALAFDAAEAAISGVAYEAEDDVLLADTATLDVISQARQDTELDPELQDLSCFDDANWVNRTLTATGLSPGVTHTATGSYNANPEVTSWSRTAFVKEQACEGSSNVIGGSNISCHIFLVRGCGQLATASFAVANTLNAATFAPASE